MKKYIFAIALILVIATALLFAFQPPSSSEKKTTANEKVSLTPKATETKTNTSIANPASKNCEEKGGKLEIVTSSDGSQFGMCQFDDYACEEWALFRDECTPDADSEKIKNALTAKGLDLSGMKVIINKHLGKYIGGSVSPVDGLGGGGYVYAVKENNEVKVLADGNGAIMCSSFTDYPDFPSFLVSNCVDESGNLLTR